MGIHTVNPVKIESPIKVERGLPNTKAVNQENKPQPKPVKKAITKTEPKKTDKATAEKKDIADKNKLKIRPVEPVESLSKGYYILQEFHANTEYGSLRKFINPRFTKALQKDIATEGLKNPNLSDEQKEKLNGIIDGIEMEEKFEGAEFKHNAPFNNFNSNFEYMESIYRLPRLDD